VSHFQWALVNVSHLSNNLLGMPQDLTWTPKSTSRSGSKRRKQTQQQVTHLHPHTHTYTHTEGSHSMWSENKSQSPSSCQKLPI